MELKGRVKESTFDDPEELRLKLEAVRRRMEEVRAEAEAEATLRDVWRFTLPLDAKWNYLNPLRDNPTFQHWGVIVADVDKDIIDKAISHRKRLKRLGRWCLGVIHELKRIGRDSAYQVPNGFRTPSKRVSVLRVWDKRRLKTPRLQRKVHRFWCRIIDPQALILLRRTRNTSWERRIARVLRSPY
jgi:hypothetical protein